MTKLILFYCSFNIQDINIVIIYKYQHVVFNRLNTNLFFFIIGFE